MHVGSKFFDRGLVEMWRLLYFRVYALRLGTTIVATFGENSEGISLNYRATLLNL